MKVSMPAGTMHGWGIAGRYLSETLSRLPAIEGVTLHCISGHDFAPLDPTRWDRINIGYCFFEHEVLAYNFIPEAARRWDFIVAGSRWCEYHLRIGGMERTATILQGVDPAFFAPQPPRTDDGRFIVFSGGKFEFRKGQDVVIAAMRLFMERHPDVRLSCAWHNQWPKSIRTMEQSRLIDFAWRDIPCDELLRETLTRNGIDLSRVIIHPPADNKTMGGIYSQSDVGLFPNRCEGGNNMVMCEYMACGRPVIASARTGHADVVGADNTFRLNRYKPAPAKIDNNITGIWFEPSIDEVLDQLEKAHSDRVMLRRAAVSAGREMGRLSWEEAARRFHAIAARLAAASAGEISIRRKANERLEEADALLLGGQHAEAEPLYRALLSESPLSHDLHNSLGTALDGQGRYMEAVVHYSKSVALSPGFHVARYNLANTMARMGNLQGAVENLVSVVEADPAFAEAWQNLALYRHQSGDLPEAIRCLQHVISLAPGRLDAHRDLGKIYMETGRKSDALACFEAILVEHPADVETLALQCDILRDTGKLEQASERLEFLLTLTPDASDRWTDLGSVYFELARYPEALASFETSLAIHPDNFISLNSKGLVLHELGDLDGAEECYMQAHALAPDNPVIQNNLGNLLKSRLRMQEAVKWYDNALRLQPDNATIIFNRSLACLAMGDTAQGWEGYERRFDMIPPVILRHKEIPRWRGEPLDGRTLLVQSEQVYGDTFMFSRFLLMSGKFDGPVVFECQDRIVRPALTALDDVLHLVAVRGERLPRIDLEIPLLSLPRIFGTAPGTIPRAEGYLRPDPARVAAWRSHMGGDNTLKVGLVWGGRKARLNSDRSMNLRDLGPLLEIPGVSFFSLQMGDDALQIHEFGARIKDLGGGIRDFGDSAAIIANLDLLVSIDTATAHLAGALGVPAWVMLKYSPDWRWFLDREDSPWYDSVRLFRQGSPGDWKGLVKEAAGCLRIKVIENEMQKKIKV